MASVKTLSRNFKVEVVLNDEELHDLIDDLEKIRAKYGHPVHDSVLWQTTEALLKQLKTIEKYNADYSELGLKRYGNEED
jgi:PleD family two-component response regulator